MLQIERIRVRVFDVPTIARPETDGTAEWYSTTMVLVELRAGGVVGLGYSYIHAAAAKLIDELFAPLVRGANPFAIGQLQVELLRAVRNHGREGIAACAMSAIDTALWDLKARLLGVPLVALLGAAREVVPVYASGGFTSTPLDALAREVESYAAAGHRRAKIKIGQPVEEALERARVLTEAAPDLELMVDGNGAFSRKEAIDLGHRLEELGIDYFEEPVTSDDLAGLRLIRDRCSLSIAAGEYGYAAIYFRRMLEADAVDILQADATRCLGFTGLLRADALCDAFEVPLSTHCAPALHAHVAHATRRLIHVESFFDHVRIESMLFDGAPVVRDGNLLVDRSRPGHGLALRAEEAARFAA